MGPQESILNAVIWLGIVVTGGLLFAVLATGCASVPERESVGESERLICTPGVLGDGTPAILCEPYGGEVRRDAAAY